MRVKHNRHAASISHIRLLVIANNPLRIISLTRVQRRRVIKPLNQPHLRSSQLNRKPGMRPSEDPGQFALLRDILLQHNRATKKRRKLLVKVNSRNLIGSRPPRPYWPIRSKCEPLHRRLSHRDRRREYNRLLRRRTYPQQPESPNPQGPPSQILTQTLLFHPFALSILRSRKRHPLKQCR